jgi:hypothetical protein
LSRKKAYFMNGGAGRTVASIPAFEKLYEKDKDFIIVCEGGMEFYKGHPQLHELAYDHWHKNLFKDYIKDRDCITPEPYRVWEYYNQKCSLAQAFDIAINNEGLREVPDPKIYMNKHELVQGYKMVEEIKAVTGKDKVLVFQPFGRTAENMGDFIIDGSSRSFHLNDVIRVCKDLRDDYAIIIMSEFPVTIEENTKVPVAVPQVPDVRVWSSVIQIADHFLGCDSLGQHMAKALGTTCTSVIGSTYPINISYPNSPDFDIIDLGEGKRKFSPIRLTMEDEIERYNDEVMELTDESFKKIVSSVRKRLGKPRSYQGTYKPQEQQGEVCPTHGVVHAQNDAGVTHAKQPAQILGRSGK